MGDTRPGNWETLCKAAATEPDPKRLLDLVSEIIAALDEHRGFEPNVREHCTERSGIAAPSTRLIDSSDVETS